MLNVAKMETVTISFHFLEPVISINRARKIGVARTKPIRIINFT